MEGVKRKGRVGRAGIEEREDRGGEGREDI